MFAYNYCLDYDHYPFYWGDCLNRCALEWSRYFGGDIPEPDIIRQDPLDQYMYHLSLLQSCQLLLFRDGCSNKRILGSVKLSPQLL